MKKTIATILLLLLLTSCNQNNENNKVGQNPEMNQHTINVKNTTINNVDRKTGQDISKRLVNLATSIPNVNDATAVVIGPYAIVGIDIKENLERSEVGSIKYSVAESLKNDPDGASAFIIADPDITARLEEISDDIENGKPVQGIFNELADITGRIIPEIPSDMINPETDGNLKEPTEKLNNQEEQNLKNDQNEQSNKHLTD